MEGNEDKTDYSIRWKPKIGSTTDEEDEIWLYRSGKKTHTVRLCGNLVFFFDLIY